MPSAQTGVVKRQRLDWVDALRALAMFMVVLVHASSKAEGWWIYNVFVAPVMLPLFFAISGYVFQDRGGKIGAFLWGLTRSLIIPWLFFAIIRTNSYRIPFGGGPAWQDVLRNVIGGHVLWFFPACIMAQVVLFIILKIGKKPILCCIGMVLACLAGFVLVKLNIGNVMMFNRALIAQVFLLIGYIFKQYQQDFKSVPRWWIPAGALVYIATGVWTMRRFPEQYIDVHLNRYPTTAALWFFMIVLGCFVLLLAFSYIPKAPKWITFLGQNTLLCYALHSYAFPRFAKLMTFLGIPTAPTWGWAIIKSVFAMAWCAVLSLILNFFIPELVGKRRKNDIVAFIKRLLTRIRRVG